MENMFDEGVIKHDGQGGYQPVTDPAEQEHIKRTDSMSKRKQTMSPAETQQIQQQLPDNDDDADEYGLE